MNSNDKQFKGILTTLGENPFSYAALGMIGGILLADIATVVVLFAFVAAVMILGVICILWTTDKNTSTGNILVTLTLMLAFAAVGFLRYESYERSIRLEWPEEKQTCYVKVDSDVKHYGKTIQLDLLLHDGLKLRANLMPHEGKEPCPGDILIIHCRISAPHNKGNPDESDYAGYLMKHGYSGTTFCYGNEWRLTGRSKPTLKDRLLKIRSSLTDKYAKYFEGKDLAVLSALTLGDKSMLNTEIREAFSETGTSHILALSGLHLGILFSIYNLLLRLLLQVSGRRRRMIQGFGFFIGLTCIWSFTLLAGMPLSLTRAAIMFSLLQCATVMERDVFSINNLALAALFLLVVSPEAVYDIGFQLSFLSVLGILLITPLFPRFKNRGRNVIERFLIGCALAMWYMLCVSVSAIIFTMPLVAYVFHIVPLFGWVASLVAIPITALILVFALMFFLLPFAQGACAVVIGFMLKLLSGCLESIASLPHAYMELYPSKAATVLLYVFIFTSFSYIIRRKPWKLIVIALTLTTVVVAEIADIKQGRIIPQIVFYNTPSAPILHVLESEDTSYIWTTMPERADSALSSIKRNFWKKRKIKTPMRLNADISIGPLIFTPHVITFRGCRIGLAYERLNYDTEKPMKVDYLYVVKGWNRSLSELFQVFSPDTIVLDASLSDYYHKKFSSEAKNLGVACHSIRNNGALRVFVSSNVSKR